MTILSLPLKVVGTELVDMQVRFVMKFYSGQKALPSKEDMLQDTKKEMSDRWSRGLSKRSAHFFGFNQVSIEINKS